MNPEPRGSSLLELATAGVLVAVLAALAGVVVLAYWPAAAQDVSDAAAGALIALLFAALGLVSLLALVHTRKHS